MIAATRLKHLGDVGCMSNPNCVYIDYIFIGYSNGEAERSLLVY